ncbi:MAG: hypothetical protein JNK53_07885 [Phycisphaerae bacterium]|nr:hypothetical protein [Phycisphaerae bacterium]
MQRTSRKHEAPISLFSFQDLMACLTGVLILIVLLIAMEGLSDEMRMAKAQVSPQASAATLQEAESQLEQLRQDVELLQRELAARQQGAAVTQAEVEVLEERTRRVEQEVTRLQERAQAMDQEVQRLVAERANIEAQATELEKRRVQAELAIRRERVRFRPGTDDGRKPVFIEVAAAGVRLGEMSSDRAPVLLAALPAAATDGHVEQALLARSPEQHYAVFVVHSDAIERFEALRTAAFRRGYEVGWQLWDGERPFLEPAP